jgi:hypothetical protein
MIRRVQITGRGLCEKGLIRKTSIEVPIFDVVHDAYSHFSDDNWLVVHFLQGK